VFVRSSEWAGNAGANWSLAGRTQPNELSSSPNIIRVIKSRRMRWAGHVARMGERRVAYMVLARKPEGKRPLGKPMRRRKDNIKNGSSRSLWGKMDRIALA